MLRAYFDVFLVYKDLGDTLCAIGVKESAAAHEAFTKFGEYHRQMEKVGIHMLKKTKRVCMFFPFCFFFELKKMRSLVN